MLLDTSCWFYLRKRIRFFQIGIDYIANRHQCSTGVKRSDDHHNDFECIPHNNDDCESSTILEGTPPRNWLTETVWHSGTLIAQKTTGSSPLISVLQVFPDKRDGTRLGMRSGIVLDEIRNNSSTEPIQWTSTVKALGLPSQNWAVRTIRCRDICIIKNQKKVAMVGD